MSQQPARPWFRLASLVRPAPPPPAWPPAPTPAQQQTFRPPVAPPPQAAQPRPPPPAPTTIPPRTSAPPSPTTSSIPSRASAPPSPTTISIPPRASAPQSPIRPATPASVSSVVSTPSRATTAPPPQTPAASPPPHAQATAPPSPAKRPAPATLTSTAIQSPKSPPKTGATQPAAPYTTPVQSAPSPISTKLTSPIPKASSSLPASPAQKASPKPSAPPPSLLQTSPAFQTVPSTPAAPQPSPVRTAAPIGTVTARGTTPVPSPKIDKPRAETQPQYTKEKILSRPPSPLTLPPAQIKTGNDQLEPIPAEVEQKIVLMQETKEISKTTPKTHNNNNNIAQHGKRELKKDKGVHTYKKDSDSEEFGMSVITLAGDNKGAIMELTPSRKKYGSEANWINGGRKPKSDSDEESSRINNDQKQHAAEEAPPLDAFVNCNIQGVNNSILYNCSCTHNDPGIHLSVSRKGKVGNAAHHMKDQTNI